MSSIDSGIMGASSPQESRAESDASRLQTCFHLLARIEEQLLFADSKAGIIATLQAFLTSPLVYNVAQIRKAFAMWDPASKVLLGGCLGAYSVLFLITMGCAGLTVLPRTRGPGRTHSKAFFGRIAREFGHSPERFIAELGRMTDRDWLDEIGRDIVHVSAIAAVKHRMARRATMASVPATIFWVLTVLVLMCAGRAYPG
jgi:hypothetical protein